MRLNEHTALSTSRVILVPYSTHHVPTYHQWMEDDSLRLATASDRLTLDEEYAMQRTWRDDHDKLTFIVCIPLPLEPNHELPMSIKPGVADAPERMIGDVNLFLYPREEDDDEASSCCSDAMVGEIEIMIARKDLQRQGYGRAALVTFMAYVLSNWSEIAAEFTSGASSVINRKASHVRLVYLRAKINKDNARSIRLFTSVSFVQIGEANYFDEVELRYSGTLDDLRELKSYEEHNHLAYG